MMLVAFRRLVLQCVKPAINLAMLYVNVVVSHVYDSTRVTLYVEVFELFSDECIPNRASRKFYLTAAGIRTRDLRISRTMLYTVWATRSSWERLVKFMMLVAFRRLVLQCVKPAINLAMLYVNVVVSHVYDSTRVTLCIYRGFWVVFRRVYTKPGKQKILLDRGWDSNPRPSHF